MRITTLRACGWMSIAFALSVAVLMLNDGVQRYPLAWWVLGQIALGVDRITKETP